MPPLAECQPCTESVNDNYTLHTGTLSVCLESDGVQRNLGNIANLTFRFTPEFVDHFAGADGQLDAKIPLRRNFIIEAILEELTPANIAVVLGENQVANTPSGCKIPLNGPDGNCTGNVGSVRFDHSFPCGSKTLTIRLWRAIIHGEMTLPFSEAITQFPILVQALSCASQHPTEPYGVIEFSEECALS